MVIAGAWRDILLLLATCIFCEDFHLHPKMESSTGGPELMERPNMVHTTSLPIRHDSGIVLRPHTQACLQLAGFLLECGHADDTSTVPVAPTFQNRAHSVRSGCKLWNAAVRRGSRTPSTELTSRICRAVTLYRLDHMDTSKLSKF